MFQVLKMQRELNARRAEHNKTLRTKFLAEKLKQLKLKTFFKQNSKNDFDNRFSTQRYFQYRFK